MLWQLLFSSTAFFALNLLAAFVFFSAGLLYFDSWQVDKGKKTPLLRSLGFFCLAAAAAYGATTLEIPAAGAAMQVVKVSGLALILYSLTSEPILSIPRRKRKKL